MTQHDCAAGGPQGEVLLMTALEALCERWRNVHPKCRAAVLTYRDTIGLIFRVEKVPSSARAISFERTPALQALDQAAIDGLLVGIWPNAMEQLDPFLAALAPAAEEPTR